VGRGSARRTENGLAFASLVTPAPDSEASRRLRRCGVGEFVVTF
jgi:hypothetical protein